MNTDQLEYNRELNERIGRLKVTKLFLLLKVEKIIPTKNIFDLIDLVVKHKNKGYAVEIKNRNPKYECYQTYIFDYAKYIGMHKRMNDLNLLYGLFVLVFGDIIYIFNIETILKNGRRSEELSWTNSLKEDKKEKIFYYIDKKYGRKFELIDNRYKLIQQ